mmetsp:Transcript_25529/g.59688  ORF Transcript_25529/g.59688 Transcript_25529/m.59688 type:complete len:204 (-) Transcript_25529:19-630(-)
MYKKRRSTSFSTHRRLTIAEGPHLADDATTMAAPMFCHLHLVHAARKQRHEGQTNATKATDYAEEDSRGSASRVAFMFDAGESDLLAERTGYGHGLPAQVRQELLAVGGYGSVSVCVGRRCRRSGWRRYGVCPRGLGRFLHDTIVGRGRNRHYRSRHRHWNGLGCCQRNVAVGGSWSGRGGDGDSRGFGCSSGILHGHNVTKQ